MKTKPNPLWARIYRKLFRSDNFSEFKKWADDSPSYTGSAVDQYWSTVDQYNFAAENVQKFLEERYNVKVYKDESLEDDSIWNMVELPYESFEDPEFTILLLSLDDGKNS